MRNSIILPNYESLKKLARNYSDVTLQPESIYSSIRREIVKKGPKHMFLVSIDYTKNCVKVTEYNDFKADYSNLINYYEKLLAKNHKIRFFFVLYGYRGRHSVFTTMRKVSYKNFSTFNFTAGEKHDIEGYHTYKCFNYA